MGFNEEIDYLEGLKTKLTSRSVNKGTAAGFKQIMKTIDKVNEDLAKLKKSAKESRKNG